MKIIKIKPLIISSVFCLLPILLGLAVYNRLPAEMAIHFNLHGVPDNTASKALTVFILPCLMVLLQIFCCFIHDINAAKKGLNKKFEIIIKSVVPTITIVIYTATIAYSLGAELDMRKIAMFIVGLIMIAEGNYMPKLNYKNYESRSGKNILRMIGYQSVIMGFVFIATIFMPPVFSVAALLLLIPCAVSVLIAAVKNK